MNLFRRLRRLGIALAFGSVAMLVQAGDEDCRIAYDMGSSGIRAGLSGGQRAPRAEIDYLAPLAAGRNLNETLEATIAALNALPESAGFPAECTRVGGGFSAWRLAAARGVSELIPALRRIKAATGVHVLVIDQQQEGAYGYGGARQLLGDRLNTSHVLDIGGGSLQIAGEQTTFGEALGQKIWRRALCQSFGQSEENCRLQPMAGEQRAAARQMAEKKLHGIRSTLPTGISLTAISRPVSRGILPALRRLTAEGSAAAGFSLESLAQAIDKLATLTPDETALLTGSQPRFVAYLLSDMLLVEAVLRLTGVNFLQVAEIDLTNLPGLLADERAFAWAEHYDCYLDRLQNRGLFAYASDPASCP